VPGRRPRTVRTALTHPPQLMPSMVIRTRCMVPW
jgi:hypothetical protein